MEVLLLWEEVGFSVRLCWWLLAIGEPADFALASLTIPLVLVLLCCGLSSLYFSFIPGPGAISVLALPSLSPAFLVCSTVVYRGCAFSLPRLGTVMTRFSPWVVRLQLSVVAVAPCLLLFRLITFSVIPSPHALCGQCLIFGCQVGSSSFLVVLWLPAAFVFVGLRLFRMTRFLFSSPGSVVGHFLPVA